MALAAHDGYRRGYVSFAHFFAVLYIYCCARFTAH